MPTTPFFKFAVGGAGVADVVTSAERLVVVMDTPADPAGGVDVVQVGFQVKNEAGDNVAGVAPLELAVFADANCAIPYARHGASGRPFSRHPMPPI